VHFWIYSRTIREAGTTVVSSVAVRPEGAYVSGHWDSQAAHSLLTTGRLFDHISRVTTLSGRGILCSEIHKITIDGIYSLLTS
jgi:hypothetical protein